MARCVERSIVCLDGKSKPTLPKKRVDTRFSEDRGVEVFQPFVPTFLFARSEKRKGVREKVWKKKGAFRLRQGSGGQERFGKRWGSSSSAEAAEDMAEGKSIKASRPAKPGNRRDIPKRTFRLSSKGLSFPLCKPSVIFSKDAGARPPRRSRRRCWACRRSCPARRRI